MVAGLFVALSGPATVPSSVNTETAADCCYDTGMIASAWSKTRTFTVGDEKTFLEQTIIAWKANSCGGARETVGLPYLRERLANSASPLSGAP